MLAHRSNLRAFAIALAVSSVSIAGFLRTEGPPSPVSANAARAEFSSERAMSALRSLLGDGQPHPTGSPANQQVRARLQALLDDIGINHAEQRGVACAHGFPTCAQVENVVARIPGRSNERAVLLLAHYDSVRAGPGAGDDGAGVAALLEIARILTAMPRPTNSIVFAFTDGEELGLLGAELFFAEHPWAREVGVVINVEGSGSSGPARLLRSGPDSAWVVDAFLERAKHPTASSLAEAVFSLMPNDTDFSVAMRRGLPGLDFAFRGQVNHYHTRNDTIENLSAATVQHHGENVLPLVLRLANMDLGSQPPGESAYLALFDAIKITWSVDWSITLATLGTLFLVGAGALATHRRHTTPRRIGVGFLCGVGASVAASAASFALLRVAQWFSGAVVAWPPSPWPFRFVLFGMGMLTVLFAGRIAYRWSDSWGLWLGGSMVWSVPALLTAALLPKSSIAFTVPLLLIGFIAMVTSTVRDRRRIVKGVIIGLAAITPFSLGLFLAIEVTQGYEFVATVFPIAALYFVALLPLLPVAADGWIDRKLVWIAAGVLIGGGLILAAAQPTYSVDRPQHINVLHIEDDSRALWMAVSRTDLPNIMEEAGRLKPARPPIRPWSILLAHKLALGVTEEPMATAATTGSPGPTIDVDVERDRQDGRRLDLTIRSRRGARDITVLIPETAKLRSAAIGGKSIPLSISPLARRYFGNYHLIMLSALTPRGARLNLNLGSRARVEVILMDSVGELPNDGRDVQRPAKLAVPVYIGDQSVRISRQKI